MPPGIFVKTTMRHDSGAEVCPSAIRLLPAMCLLSLVRCHSIRIGPRPPWPTCR